LNDKFAGTDRPASQIKNPNVMLGFSGAVGTRTVWGRFCLAADFDDSDDPFFREE
jgi:hypothetical protein